jgi:hypothetical protein
VRILGVQECAHSTGIHILDHHYSVKRHPGVRRIPLQGRSCNRTCSRMCAIVSKMGKES